MRIGYYPGCSLLGSSREFDESVRAVAAAIGLMLYFDGAVFFHLRVKDKMKNFAPAMVLGWLAIAVAILEITAR